MGKNKNRALPNNQGIGGFQRWMPEEWDWGTVKGNVGSNRDGNIKDQAKQQNTCFKQLSLEEIQKKRMKGLCFAYDEKLSPNHVCKNKNLKILMLEEVEPVKPGEMVVSKLTLLSMAALTSKNSSNLFGLTPILSLHSSHWACVKFNTLKLRNFNNL